ncbi:MAG: YicC family protein [Nitrospiraceae bacterium]|nr:MAG: YicC family protein [Nitrospiraceae bacterium]
MDWMTMAQSMTGYGTGTSGNFRVEVRSSNHKNMDIHVNIPSYLFSCEPEIKKRVKTRFQRGRIDVFIPRREAETVKLSVNRLLAREYYRALMDLKGELSLNGDVGIDILAAQREIFILDEPDADVSGLYEALDSALDELELSRQAEAKNLVHDMEERIGLIQGHVAGIEGRRADFIASARDRLLQSLKELLGSAGIDETRLVQETAILVERTDITEEVVRMKSHLKHFSQVLETGNAIGKKLDFIIQELRREINTIGSKVQSYDIAGKVVEVKHELEKIREQVQNLQ